jgi:heterodisulfide reductase subunit C
VVETVSNPSERNVTVFKPSWEFAKEIIDRGGKIFNPEDLETLYACIQCGGCTGSCPAGRRTALNTRRVIRKIQLGLKDDVLSTDDLWTCVTCYTCQERCPRQVMITDIIRTVRNIAFEKGFAKDRHLLVVRNFIKTGHSVPITDEIKKARGKLGLDTVPPTTLKSEADLKELNRVMALSGFLAKVR